MRDLTSSPEEERKNLVERLADCVSQIQRQNETIRALRAEVEKKEEVFYEEKLKTLQDEHEEALSQSFIKLKELHNKNKKLLETISHLEDLTRKFHRKYREKELEIQKLQHFYKK